MFKEKILDYLRNEIDRPIMDIELESLLEIEEAEIPYFRNVLKELVDDGHLIVTKKKKYGLPEMFSMYSGTIQITAKGFGFVIADNKELSDIFIPPQEIQGAMNGDRVLVKLIKKSTEAKRPEGTVVQIIKRHNAEIVGSYQHSGNYGFVVPDDKRVHKDIFIPGGQSKDAKDNDKVIVKIINFGDETHNPEGEIIEIIGQKGDQGVDILSVIKKFKLPETFPNKVIKESEKIPAEVHPEELAKRKDLRDRVIITIDGEDAKDLDDAVEVEKLSNGNYRLGVHIADVSYYVKEKSPIDAEALKRATSVYLIDRVVPMLPERLSNGICSLNPNVDRLTMSCTMEINQKGEVVDHEIYQSVINSKARMTYTIVSDVLEGKNLEAHVGYSHLFDTFKVMEELCLILKNKREKRGAIDFDFPEPKVVLDETGKAVDIKRYDRRISNRIIEEFMLAANETVAEHFFWLEAPFVYRIHENPSEDRITTFNAFIHNLGYFIKGIDSGEVHPRAIQTLLREVEGKKEENIINKLMLRALKQARYSPIDEGHFGLAAEHYCHFTSPIRRYPDLQIHRIIREYIDGTINENRISKLKAIVEEAADISSERERLAEQAERDVDDMKKAEYMMQFIGDEFDGLVSSVTSFGMFIELDNTVEGLIRMNALDDDYYVFDQEKLMLVGEHTKQTYTIGDALRIKVDKVNIDTREIDFSLIEKYEIDGSKDGNNKNTIGKKVWKKR